MRHDPLPRHRYTLLRDLRVRMQRAMAPLLDAAAAANEGPEHEEVVYQRCLQHADFLDLQVALGQELTAACAELDVAHADGIASAVTDGRAASEGSASTCADGMHDALVDNLYMRLPWCRQRHSRRALRHRPRALPPSSPPSPTRAATVLAPTPTRARRWSSPTATPPTAAAKAAVAKAAATAAAATATTRSW